MRQVEQLITDNLDVWTSAIKKRGSQGRGSSKKIELYGIKKLRELILELAVRGLLVPQDANDEPASVLLEKIAVEKERLLKEGGTKKQKPLPEVSDDERTFTLPLGWESVQFGRVALIERGGSPRPIKSYLTDDPEGLNWIKIGDTEQGGKYITSTCEKIRKEGLSKTRMVYPGDFLLTNSMSFGRPYITKIEGCIHDGWLRISPPKSIDKDYLYLLLSSPFIVSAFKKAAAGAVVLNLNADKVREVDILIPPEAEQTRIVAKVDELMALCDQLEQQTEDSLSAHQTLVEILLNTLLDAAQSRDDNSSKESAFDQAWQRIAEHFDVLFTTEHSIDQLKQTILQLAVMGKLVPQDPNDEPASVLLEKIAAEKERLVKEGKIKKQKPLPPIGEDEKPFELPVGWEWCRGEEVADFIDPQPSHRTPPVVEGGVPYVGYTDIDHTRGIDFQGARKVSLDVFREHQERYQLKVGDFVFGKIGTLGQPFFLAEPFNYCLSANLILIQPNLEAVYPNFLALYLNSPTLYKLLDDQKTNSTHGVFGIKKARLLLVPSPPLIEQRKIAEKVDALMSLCDALKDGIQESQNTQLYLADALTR